MMKTKISARIFSVALAILLPVLSKGQNKLPACNDTVVINSFVKCYGYGYSEIDTVLVRVYDKGNGFMTTKDSFYVYPGIKSADTVQKVRFLDIGGTHPIKNSEDWSFELSNHQLFRISDVKTAIVTERHQFKRCRMVGFKLNGKSTTANEVEIVHNGFKKIKVRGTKGKSRKIGDNRRIL